MRFRYTYDTVGLIAYLLCAQRALFGCATHSAGPFDIERPRWSAAKQPSQARDALTTLPPPAPAGGCGLVCCPPAASLCC